MNINQSAVNSIIKTIKIMIENQFKSASFDITRRGQIAKVLGNHKYSVSIKGTEYSVPCAINLTFTKGDSVYVLFPQGNAVDAHITGKVG